MALTPKKKKFADEIKKGANQTQAYKKAYNCKNMKSETITNLASKLAHDPDVVARLKTIQDKLDKSTIADAQELQETLTKLLRGEINEQCVVVESTGDYQSQSNAYLAQCSSHRAAALSKSNAYLAQPSSGRAAALLRKATIIEKQVTPKDRIKAGELLAKLRGDFNINLNISEAPIIKDDI